MAAYYKTECNWLYKWWEVALYRFGVSNVMFRCLTHREAVSFIESFTSSPLLVA